MVVGLLQMHLAIREARSLKDKRQVIKSLRDRIRHAAIATVRGRYALDKVGARVTTYLSEVIAGPTHQG